jgi:two-component system sensor histidine kinase KdpD
MRLGIRRPMRPVRPWVGVAIAIAAPVCATLLALPFSDASDEAAAASLYLLAVVVAAALGGLWSGLAASVLSFLGLNFFFTEPEHTFRVGKTQDLVALLVFLLVASIVGALLARALEERARATERERQAALLNYIATKLLAPEPLERRLGDLATALLDPFDLVRCELRARVLDDELTVARERSGAPGERITVPMLAAKEPSGTLSAVRREGAPDLAASDRELLEACGRQISVALERARLDAEVEAARVASEASQMRAALFSSVTHDLRTPLASIKASVTSLLDEDVAHERPQELELLQTVLHETDRLNQLVGNILDLARVRAGSLVPAKELGSIEEVLESVLHRMQRGLERVSLRVLVRPDLPDVMMDPVQIDQVLTNLMENAIRFSPPGAELQIAVVPWRDGVQVRISDRGPGIPPEERERVFEPFYRGASADGTGGSGLGLAIARAVILAHGGRIRIEGSPSGGASVVFDLPADAPAVPQEPVM